LLTFRNAKLPNEAKKPLERRDFVTENKGVN
jgi:hypothetical protein